MKFLNKLFNLNTHGKNLDDHNFKPCDVFLGGYNPQSTFDNEFDVNDGALINGKVTDKSEYFLDIGYTVDATSVEYTPETENVDNVQQILGTADVALMNETAVLSGTAANVNTDTIAKLLPATNKYKDANDKTIGLSVGSSKIISLKKTSALPIVVHPTAMTWKENKSAGAREISKANDAELVQRANFANAFIINAGSPNKKEIFVGGAENTSLTDALATANSKDITFKGAVDLSSASVGDTVKILLDNEKYFISTIDALNDTADTITLETAVPSVSNNSENGNELNIYTKVSLTSIVQYDIVKLNVDNGSVNALVDSVEDDLNKITVMDDINDSCIDAGNTIEIMMGKEIKSTTALTSSIVPTISTGNEVEIKLSDNSSIGSEISDVANINSNYVSLANPLFDSAANIKALKGEIIVTKSELENSASNEYTFHINSAKETFEFEGSVFGTITDKKTLPELNNGRIWPQRLIKVMYQSVGLYVLDSNGNTYNNITSLYTEKNWYNVDGNGEKSDYTPSDKGEYCIDYQNGKMKIMALDVHNGKKLFISFNILSTEDDTICYQCISTNPLTIVNDKGTRQSLPFSFNVLKDNVRKDGDQLWFKGYKKD